MGVFAFLTSSKLKAELIRQRDEIARLHQIQGAEIALKKEAQKLSEEQAQKNQQLEKENHDIKAQNKTLEKDIQKERAIAKKKLDEELDKIQKKVDKEIHDMEVRLSTLRQELEEKQHQRAEATEQNAVLAEKVAQLEARTQQFPVKNLLYGQIGRKRP